MPEKSENLTPLDLLKEQLKSYRFSGLDQRSVSDFYRSRKTNLLGGNGLILSEFISLAKANAIGEPDPKIAKRISAPQFNESKIDHILDSVNSREINSFLMQLSAVLYASNVDSRIMDSVEKNGLQATLPAIFESPQYSSVMEMFNLDSRPLSFKEVVENASEDGPVYGVSVEINGSDGLIVIDMPSSTVLETEDPQARPHD